MRLIGKVHINAMINKDGLLYLPSQDHARRKTENEYNNLSGISYKEVDCLSN